MRLADTHVRKRREPILNPWYRVARSRRYLVDNSTRIVSHSTSQMRSVAHSILQIALLEPAPRRPVVASLNELPHEQRDIIAPNASGQMSGLPDQCGDGPGSAEP